MGTDTAPVMENAKLCRFHRKCDIFWISVTISEICMYVSASVAGCWGFCDWAKMGYNHFNYSDREYTRSKQTARTAACVTSETKNILIHPQTGQLRERLFTCSSTLTRETLRLHQSAQKIPYKIKNSSHDLTNMVVMQACFIMRKKCRTRKRFMWLDALG